MAAWNDQIERSEQQKPGLYYRNNVLAPDDFFGSRHSLHQLHLPLHETGYSCLIHAPVSRGMFITIIIPLYTLAI